MNNDFIKLKKSSVLKIGIKDEEGNDTGEHLEFDMEDIELPLKINQCEAQHKKNIQDLKMQFAIIDKKEDRKGKYLLSYKEEEKMKALQKFYQREMEAFDLFLGKNGTKKMLNGRQPYFTMYDDIAESLEPIMPKLQARTEDITKKIKEKYSSSIEKDVLE